MSKKSTMKVHEYISEQINLCGKSQKEIADLAGYDKPNNITMIKQGKSKIAIDRVPAFAAAIGVDPLHLLRLVMQEYMPSTWSTVESVLGKSFVTDSELNVVEIFRKVSCGVDIALNSSREHELAELVLKWRNGEVDAINATRRRIQREKTGKEDGAELLTLNNDIDALLK